jgi:hypothetical protein
LTGILLQIAEQFLGIYVCDVDKKEKLGKGWRRQYYGKHDLVKKDRSK